MRCVMGCVGALVTRLGPEVDVAVMLESFLQVCCLGGRCMHY